ncbi:MAG TPA: lysophospholipid acyltransferase family protein [Terriglobales bacterium]|nr:lysophospholipid acyltransferase family protein [Terriglobales bacterium]
MTLRYWLEYQLLRALLSTIGALPFDLALRIGAATGELLYRLARRQREVGLHNLAIAFPDKTIAQHQAILRASCRNLGRIAVEFCHFPHFDRSEIDRRVSVADPPRWQTALATAAEKGAVVLTAHFGNWELLAYASGTWGHPITVVNRTMRNQAVDRLIIDWRARAGTRSLPKKAAAKEAIRTLRRKQILAIPTDQNQPARDGVFVDFFGKPACTSAGAARLAALTGAPIFPVFLVRQAESAHHQIVVLPQLELVDSGDREADARINTERCSKVIEAMLRQYPEQWIWFHQRWKTRPPSERALQLDGADL